MYFIGRYSSQEVLRGFELTSLQLVRKSNLSTSRNREENRSLFEMHISFQLINPEPDVVSSAAEAPCSPVKSIHLSISSGSETHSLICDCRPPALWK